MGKRRDVNSSKKKKVLLKVSGLKGGDYTNIILAKERGKEKGDGTAGKKKKRKFAASSCCLGKFLRKTCKDDIRV